MDCSSNEQQGLFNLKPGKPNVLTNKFEESLELTVSKFTKIEIGNISRMLYNNHFERLIKVKP